MRDKVQIIAEAGVNHNGQLDLALKLIDIAFESGADMVKFQTGVPSLLISKNAVKANYQLTTTDPNETSLKMCEKLALSFENHKILKEYAEKKGIGFLSAPFDIVSIDFLNQLGLDCFKIPSGELTNLPYLRKIGSLKKKIIMSTGMADLDEIKSSLDILTSSGTLKKNITVLHCNTEYPTPFKDVNLLAMLTIRDFFKVKVGYSDHTLGIEVPIAAAALGASVIEKHFTLDRNMEGPDHKASLEPDELAQMVKAIRNIEVGLGNGIKKPSQSEIKNIKVVRKSIVASRNIKKGEYFDSGNISTKRPGNGISPMEWDRVLGKRAKRNFENDELISL